MAARTRAVAEQVCAAIGEKFRVEIGGFRDTSVGPHPIANALVIFKPD
jgi:aromatic ring-cleaving dioxygenase